MKTNNMNYMFNVEYYDGIEHLKDKSFPVDRNKEITKFEFSKENPVVSSDISQVKGYTYIELYVSYPGLLIGIGNPHDLPVEGAIKCGFSFDYTTGLPYLPGSSLKGMLKSLFPEEKSKEKELNEVKAELIKELLESLDNCGADLSTLTMEELTELIFNNNDIFIGGYPVVQGEKQALLAMEFITPHTEGLLKNPNPVNLLKIKPNVKMRFDFILNDDSNREITIDNSKDENSSNDVCSKKKVVKGLSIENKKDIFRELLLLGGIGAKTNVGFGVLSEEKASEVGVKEYVYENHTPCARNNHDGNSGQNNHDGNNIQSNHGQRRIEDQGQNNYVLGQEYTGRVTGYNKTGKFAYITLDDGGKASAYDKKHTYKDCDVVVKYDGKKTGTDGTEYDQWEIMK